jgi:hypothetical protein
MSTPLDTPAPPENARYHVPGNVGPKILYLIASLLVFGFGWLFVWEPLGRLLFGETTQARVAEIRVVEPGQPDIVYNYRRDYEPERNLSITFQHYVAINIDGKPVLHRISVDSRKVPIPTLNYNDLVKVAYYPDDEKRLAFAYTQERTWGVGGLFMGIGGVMLMTAIPMLVTARRRILIDPE